MAYIITSIRYGTSEADNTYYAASQESFSVKEFKSPSAVFSLLDAVAIEGNKASLAVGAEVSQSLLLEKASELSERELQEPKASGIAALDNVTKRMEKAFHGAAHLLAVKLLLSAPVVVRFHNDTDGSSGAYGLYKSISAMLKRNGIEGRSNITWRMHGGISYSRMDAQFDTLYANGFSSIEKPLLIIIDFGTSVESNEGIEELGESFDIIWLDHHPIEKGFKGIGLEHYINPWNFESDSNYTAGFLACEFARCFSDFDVHDAEYASLIGDFSTHARSEEKASKLALLLELITSDKRIAFKTLDQNLTPLEIDSILSDEGKFNDLIGYASAKMGEALDVALQVMKVYKAKNASVYVADFKTVRGEDLELRYPLPGRFASKLAAKIEELEEKPFVLSLHFGSIISIRQSRRLNEKLDLTKVAKAMKESLSSVSAAGGHKSAISIKLADENSKKEALPMLISILKAELDAI